MADMNESWTSLTSPLGQALLQVVLPSELRSAFLRFLKRILGCYSSHCYFEINENDGVKTNDLYNSVQIYLSSIAFASCSRLSLTRARNSRATTFGLSNNGRVADVFDGVAVQWEHVVTQRHSQTSSWQSQPDEKRSFTLRIRKHDKDLIHKPYVDYIMGKAEEIHRNNRERLIYTNSGGGWKPVSFKHPGTFDTLAMDPEMKRDIMEDLRHFAAEKAFYQMMDRAWKRGYLLYGPPGTGKLSMIAAMANFLRYDY